MTIHADPHILTINGGSSSIKFAVFSSAASPERLFSGEVERIGSAGARLSTVDDQSAKPLVHPVTATTFRDGIESILVYLREKIAVSSIVAIGHRIVHGGAHLTRHQRINPELIAELHQTEPLDLAHLPREIALIEGFRDAFPEVPQFACFDTVFHHDMPTVAKLLPIPRRYYDAGLRRFGFHGLSYTYLMSELERLAGPGAVAGRVVLAHLGSGASMASVRGGKPIDTTMGFTPASGLVMGTRPGDMDPGLLIYLMHEQKRSTAEMDNFISKQCGLLGLSETSADMRDLLAARAVDSRAADAVELFCYQAKKHLCALTATLGGLDTVVFAGGIGERSPEVREAICEGLEFLGLKVDRSRNAKGTGIISTDDSRVKIRIIPTDEELVIARIVRSIHTTAEPSGAH